MELGEIAKELVWDVAVEVALRDLFAAVPLLAWGPVGFVVSWAMRKLSAKIYAALDQAATLEVISMRNGSHRKAHDAASVRLKVIALKSGIESPEFREERENAKRALADFVRVS